MLNRIFIRARVAFVAWALLSLVGMVFFDQDALDAATPPFNAYSISSLGGACGTQGTLIFQSANGLSKCLGVGTSGQVLISQGSGADLAWHTTAGTGTVTSVGLSAPAMFTVSGSPVTGAGTLTFALASETANTFLAAPNGSAGAPTFRAIGAADIPPINLASTANGGVASASVLPISNGGTGTTTPALVAGTNIGVSGSWPNQTINNTSAANVANSGTPTNGQLAQWINATQIQGVTLGANVLSALENALNGAGGLIGYNTLGSGVYTALTNTINSNGGVAGVSGAQTVGHCLQWASGGVADSGAPCASGSPPVLLATLTASGSATLSDTTHITASYDRYLLVFENLVPATSSVQFEIQFHANSAFQGSAYEDYALMFGSTYTRTLNTSGILTPSITTPAAVSGDLMLFQPSVTANVKSFYAHLIPSPTSGGGTPQMDEGYWNNTTYAVDGFQVLFSSGNITSGTVKLYGLN